MPAPEPTPSKLPALKGSRERGDRTAGRHDPKRVDIELSRDVEAPLRTSATDRGWKKVAAVPTPSTVDAFHGCPAIVVTAPLASLRIVLVYRSAKYSCRLPPGPGRPDEEARGGGSAVHVPETKCETAPVVASSPTSPERSRSRSCGRCSRDLRRVEGWPPARRP